MSQETHSGMWIGFRQPVRRVAMERAGKKVRFTHEANPGEVWEEAEFWVELTGRMDADGSLGIRRYVESPNRPGELITQDEYWAWIFEHSVPGLPEAASAQDLSPLQYMRKYGCFEVLAENYLPYEAERGPVPLDAAVAGEGLVTSADGSRLGVVVDGVMREGFKTPSGKLELFTETLRDWGWPELDRVVPWWLKSHVHPSLIDREAGEMILLPNFRLPTLIHTRSANCKWLYEISHTNPVWMNPLDGKRLGLETGDLCRVETEIGWFVDKVWITEGIKPGIIAMSHHLGRWRLQDDAGGNKGTTALARLEEDGQGGHTLQLLKGAGRYESPDPDTSRIWWEDVGVHQNLTHPVQPDPVSGHHCWLVKALSVRRARVGEKHGTVHVDTQKSREIYRKWHALTRSAVDHSPDGTRRPLWLKRPLKPVAAAYRLPKKPFGR
jgi:anaerobic selenocysteine-containing dehydrogenase